MAEVQVVLTEGLDGDPKRVLARVAAAYEEGPAINDRVAQIFKLAADLQAGEG